MTKTISGLCKRIFSGWGTLHKPHNPQPDVTEDIREEYAKAFRTQSYFDFWNRVLDITNLDPAKSVSIDSPTTSSNRLPSYRLFAEHLLDPDQPTITELLEKFQFINDTKLLLVDYFLETANASFLCSHLLKDIDQIRAKHHTNKPFAPHSFSTPRFQDVRARCARLLKRLEANRDKTCTRLRFLKRVKHGLATVFVIATVSLTLVIVTHGCMALVASPVVVAASIRIRSMEKLAKAYAQLDAASKGAYILTRDLDTISRMVARVKDDMEHIGAKVGLVEVLRGEERLEGNEEVVRQLRKNEVGLREELDELEEHLYLCLITINRARNLVVKEILEFKAN